MADIELVIKIPEHLYKLLKEFPSDSNEGNIENVLMKAVEHSTPLPKGHGRLIDANTLEEKVEKHREMLKISQYDRDLVLHYTDIEMAPTIIEGE